MAAATTTAVLIKIMPEKCGDVVPLSDSDADKMRLQVPNGTVVTVGSSKDCDLVLKRSMGVHPVQATIESLGGDYFVCSSDSGTYRFEKALRPKVQYELKHNDILKFGSVVFRLEIPGTNKDFAVQTCPEDIVRESLALTREVSSPFETLKTAPDDVPETLEESSLFADLDKFNNEEEDILAGDEGALFPETQPPLGDDWIHTETTPVKDVSSVAETPNSADRNSLNLRLSVTPVDGDESGVEPKTRLDSDYSESGEMLFAESAGPIGDKGTGIESPVDTGVAHATVPVSDLSFSDDEDAEDLFVETQIITDNAGNCSNPSARTKENVRKDTVERNGNDFDESDGRNEEHFARSERKNEEELEASPKKGNGDLASNSGSLEATLPAEALIETQPYFEGVSALPDAPSREEWTEVAEESPTRDHNVAVVDLTHSQAFAETQAFIGGKPYIKQEEDVESDSEMTAEQMTIEAMNRKKNLLLPRSVTPNTDGDKDPYAPSEISPQKTLDVSTPTSTARCSQHYPLHMTEGTPRYQQLFYSEKGGKKSARKKKQMPGTLSTPELVTTQTRLSPFKGTRRTQQGNQHQQTVSPIATNSGSAEKRSDILTTNQRDGSSAAQTSEPNTEAKEMDIENSPTCRKSYAALDNQTSPGKRCAEENVAAAAVGSPEKRLRRQLSSMEYEDFKASAAAISVPVNAELAVSGVVLIEGIGLDLKEQSKDGGVPEASPEPVPVDVVSAGLATLKNLVAMETGKGRQKRRQKNAKSKKDTAVASSPSPLKEAPNPVRRSARKNSARNSQNQNIDDSISSLSESDCPIVSKTTTEAKPRTSGRQKKQCQREEPDRADSASKMKRDSKKKTPASKSARRFIDDSDSSCRSSQSQRQKRASSQSTHRIVFCRTGMETEPYEKIVKVLGGTLLKCKETDKDFLDVFEKTTHVVTGKFDRTTKILCAIGSKKILVPFRWLDACSEAGKFLDCDSFALEDKEAEKKFGFRLKTLLGKSGKEKPILSGKQFFLTKSLEKPSRSCLISIIDCCGGRVLQRPPAPNVDDKNSTWVISCEKDLNERAVKEAFTPVVTSEFILSGILQWKLETELHLLKCDEGKKVAIGKGKKT